VVAATPRLSNAVSRLGGEHIVIKELIEDLLGRVGPPVPADQVDAIRAHGTALLARLARHRQRGADLVHEAYEVDLGGET